MTGRRIGLAEVLIFSICVVSVMNILFANYHLIDDGGASTTGLLNTPQKNQRQLGRTKIKRKRRNNEKDLNSASEIRPNEVTNQKGNNKEEVKIQKEDKEEEHTVAGLSCSEYGGPPDDYATSEIVFWSDIPSDAKYHSPFYDHNNVKYLAFQPDGGGWNNIRMAMETALVMAHAMGRTLVLPPKDRMYLLGTELSFNDFFHLESIDREHEKFDIITMEEFLEREAMTGNLVDAKKTKLMPPDKRTNWDNQHLKPLWEYLKSVSYNLVGCEVMHCFLAMPATTDPQNVDKLRKVYDDIASEKDGRKKPKWEDFIDKPTPVDGPVMERMREMLAGRTPLIYDTEMQNAKVLYPTERLLSHFYAHIFFEDWRQDLWSKRFVRDHMRYVDKLMCAAARIVRAVREKARKHNATNTDGIFDSMHIRRGDFQFTPTRLSAEDLIKESEKELTQGGTLYIATDERDKTFFKPFAEKYDIYFLDDFADEYTDIDKTYYGMLDQIVASKGRVFYGTWWSTLSGYVNRMRGYYITKHKLDGYKDGTMQSYYFTPQERKMVMVKYHPVKDPFYMREFPTAWKDIDDGIEDIERIVNAYEGNGLISEQ